MIDIDKIEAAAKTAVQYPFNTKRQSDHRWQTLPATVLEMVSMIRERDAVLRRALKALEVISSGVCEAAHHAKEDRHDMGVLCPIEKRHDEAIEAIKRVLNG